MKLLARYTRLQQHSHFIHFTFTSTQTKFRYRSILASVYFYVPYCYLAQLNRVSIKLVALSPLCGVRMSTALKCSLVKYTGFILTDHRGTAATNLFRSLFSEVCRYTNK